jgi:hypothetical protein
MVLAWTRVSPLWSSKTWVRLCDLRIFVDQPVEDLASGNPVRRSVPVEVDGSVLEIPDRAGCPSVASYLPWLWVAGAGWWCSDAVVWRGGGSCGRRVGFIGGVAVSIRSRGRRWGMGVRGWWLGVGMAVGSSGSSCRWVWMVVAVGSAAVATRRAGLRSRCLGGCGCRGRGTKTAMC